MIPIKKIKNDGDIHLYQFQATETIHTDLTSFFGDLGFDDQALLDLDTIFTTLDGEYFCIRNKSIKAHFFIAYGDIQMVLDTRIAQEELFEKMKTTFLFPGFASRTDKHSEK